MTTTFFSLADSCAVKEHNRFMKRICDDKESDAKFFKCLQSEEIYKVYTKLIDRQLEILLSYICPNDDSFYQACGLEKDSIPIKNSLEEAPCGHICNEGSLIKLDKSPEEEMCNQFIKEDISIVPTTRGLCDGIVTANRFRAFTTTDMEVFCNGYSYGLVCDTGWYNFLPAYLIICDPVHPYSIRCLDRADADICSSNEVTYCQKFDADFLTIPLYNFSRCGPIGHIDFFSSNNAVTIKPLCVGFEDQTNCSDPSRVGLACEINGFPSTVARQVICNPNIPVRPPLCDDGLDVKCLEISLTCTIHKHQLCDGVVDCLDSTDESSCAAITEKPCLRRYIRESDTPKVGVPLKWIKDGEIDCLDSEDEEEDWPSCGFGKTRRYSLKNSTCSEVYLCYKGFIEFSDLCDGKDSCGNENQVCRKSRKLHDIFQSPISIGGEQQLLLHCLHGLESLDKAIGGNCTNHYFTVPIYRVLGRDGFRHLFLPQASNFLKDCNHLYGAAYVYLSCLNLCSNSPCVLELLKFDSCRAQFKERIFTIANNQKLTFLIKNRKSGTYENDIFPCKNGKCVSYDEVCNLVDDCGDGSDEEKCTNHFQCKDGDYIPITKLCDKKIDCLDLTDECNEFCNEGMIKSFGVEVLGWILGMLAIIFNIATIPKTKKLLLKSKTNESLYNNVFLLIISLGDLLVGTFITTVSAYNMFYGASYCRKQLQWLTSRTCSYLGVISSIGSMISVLAMSFLSLCRAINLSCGLSISLPVTRKGTLKISFVGLLIIMIATTASVTPLVDSLEDYFVNGLYHGSDNPLFVGAPSKTEHLEILEAYYGRLGSRSISWKLVRQLTSGMFSNDNSGVQFMKVQFYGNDAVCIFKYFVTRKDPQHTFVWIALAIFIVNFLIVMLAYSTIVKTVVHSASKVTRQGANKAITKRLQKMQNKIAIIVLSDFISWIPFIILSILHSFYIFEATKWYSIFSLVINPLNSVLNPLILNSAIISKIVYFYQSMKFFIGKMLARGENDANAVRVVQNREAVESFNNEPPHLQICNLNNEIEDGIAVRN